MKDMEKSEGITGAIAIAPPSSRVADQPPRSCAHHLLRNRTDATSLIAMSTSMTPRPNRKLISGIMRAYEDMVYEAEMAETIIRSIAGVFLNRA